MNQRVKYGGNVRERKRCLHIFLIGETDRQLTVINQSPEHRHASITSEKDLRSSIAPQSADLPRLGFSLAPLVSGRAGSAAIRERQTLSPRNRGGSRLILDLGKDGALSEFCEVTALACWILLWNPVCGSYSAQSHLPRVMAPKDQNHDREHTRRAKPVQIAR